MPDDNAVLKPTTGHYYKAPVGTVIKMADLLAPPAPWTELGHTSIEDLLSITSEGGEATVLGTLQNKNLRTTYSTRTETMAFTLLEFDIEGLKLYYGKNAPELTGDLAGFLGVPTDPVPTDAAFLVVFEDGDNAFGFYAPKTEILRGDDLSLEDTENFAGLPLAVKPLNMGTNKWAYAVTPLATI
jgi:hypothetical protein